MQKVNIISEEECINILGMIATISNYLHGHASYDGAEEEAKEIIDKLDYIFRM